MESTKYPPVITKRNFVERYALGEFGNCSPTWNTFAEFEQHSKIYKTATEAYHSPKYHLRNRVVGGETHYDISAFYAYVEWLKKKDKESWYCSMMAPTHLTLINGEVMQSEQGLQLFYSEVKKPMRDSLKEGGKQVTGVVASMTLRHFMNPKSYDWLQVLLDRYPYHVVEFSCYGVCWGTLIGYNTAFWEVRLGY